MPVIETLYQVSCMVDVGVMNGSMVLKWLWKVQLDFTLWKR